MSKSPTCGAIPPAPCLFILCCLVNHNSFFYVIYFFPASTARSASRPFHGHTHLRHATPGPTPLDKLSAQRRDLYMTTHNIHEKQTSIPPSGIRTRNARKRATADTLLRWRSHWNRPLLPNTLINSRNILENMESVI